MRASTASTLAISCLVAAAVPRLVAGAPATAVERFIDTIERAPIPYQAHRRLEASSAKLHESAWLEAVTEYAPESGFHYRVTAQGGSDRILNRVLRPVLDKEQESWNGADWRKSALSRDNYDFNFGSRSPDGLIQIVLNPRRRDSRLVDGVALLSSQSGELVRLEGRLSKSPSFWVRWVDVTRHYLPIRGLMMPVAVESTADVKIAGLSTFSMRYEYAMVDGQTLPSPPASAWQALSSPVILASR